MEKQCAQKEKPYFTICIPTYNRAHILVRTLDSIRNQEFSDYEVLIIDDGSSDNTKEVVEEYTNQHQLNNKFHYYYKENGGKHTALNVGIEKASGVFFLILDSDDWLSNNALEIIHSHCKQIENDNNFNGVIGRSINASTNSIIGDRFDDDYKVTSYFEYHFVLPFKMFITDCMEANKTEILKKYRYPEPDGTKFVNEAWLFDQIGVKYKMIATNDVFQFKEYQDDGITKNAYDYKTKNIVGFLYHYISRIENVLPNAPIHGINKMKLYTIAWWRYWEAVEIDKDNKGPRITNLTAFAMVIRLFQPYISKYYNKKGL